jgi:hypothetical protein
MWKLPSAVTEIARTILTGGLALLTLTALGACQPTVNGKPLMTDPAEILMAGVRSTAALHSVHARLEMTIQGAPAQGFGGMVPAGRAAVDIDADLDSRNLAGRAVATFQGAPDMTADVIVVSGTTFTKTQPDTRWTQMPNVGGPPQFPTNDQLAEAISSVLDTGSIDLQLFDAEPCGEATCYHVIAGLDAADLGLLLGPLLGVGFGAGPRDINMPPIALDLFVDQATGRLVSVHAAIASQGLSTAVTLTLSNYDAEVVIAPPPPRLVDRMDNGFFGGTTTIIGGDEDSEPDPDFPDPIFEETPQPSF